MQYCFHNYFPLANSCLNWVGTDQPNNQRSKLDPAFEPIWAKSGWTNSTVINYKFNSGGFRTDEFDQSRRILVLGSSATVGVGLHREQTWTELLSKKTNVPVWNLATGTGCLDTMYRVLKNYLPQLNVSMVVEFGGDKDAFEIYYQNKWHIVNSPLDYSDYPDMQGVTSVWYTYPKNQQTNQEKNADAMQWICSQHQVPYYKFSPADIVLDPTVAAMDWSRCGNHGGPKRHVAIADYVSNRINL
jgi:hypothetical protein